MDKSFYSDNTVDSMFMIRLEAHFRDMPDKTVFRDDISEPGMTYGELDDISGRVLPAFSGFFMDVSKELSLTELK